MQAASVSAISGSAADARSPSAPRHNDRHETHKMNLRPLTFLLPGPMRAPKLLLLFARAIIPGCAGTVNGETPLLRDRGEPPLVLKTAHTECM
jgi:hypothetical protein